MSDNTTLPGTGDVIADEDVAGIKYQRMKLIDATVGSTTPTGTNANPIKTASPDNQSLRAVTLTTTGADSSVDCTGYGAVQWQLGGVWSGAAIFEVSNDGSANSWLPQLCLDVSTSLPLDSVTGPGIYQVVPAGKFVRVNVKQINGSMAVLALGKQFPATFSMDAIALAMDRANGMPLFVAPGITGPTPQAQALPVTLSNEERLDFCYTVPFRGALLGGNMLTGDYNWLDVSQYAGIYFSTINITSGGFFVVECCNEPNGPVTNPFGVSWSTGAVTGPSTLTGWGNTVAITNGQQHYVVPNGRYIRYRIVNVTNNGGSMIVRMLRNPIPAVASGYSATLLAGSNLAGDVGVQYRANATGAASVVSVLSPLTPAAATIKASAGRLLGWMLQNSAAAFRSVKVFNASAPTLGTTAAVFEIDIPAGGAAFMQLEGGIGFATAMTWSVTSAKGLTDNTATGLAANDVSGLFVFA